MAQAPEAKIVQISNEKPLVAELNGNENWDGWELDECRTARIWLPVIGIFNLA